MKQGNYFPHFSNARNDRKIKRLRKDLQAEGYAIYFYLLEVLREQPEYKYPILDIDLLADDFDVSEIKIKQVLQAYDLFQIDIENNFFSAKFTENMQPYLTKVAQRRIAGLRSAEIRKQKALSSDFQNDTQNEKAILFNDRSTTVQQPFNECSTTVQQPFNDRSTNKLKENKIKESKINKNNIEVFLNGNENDFEIKDQNFEANKPLINKTALFFGITEMNNANMYFYIASRINLMDSPAHFEKQFEAYKEFKKLSRQTLHGLKAFLGDNDTLGAWLSENWIHKLAAYKETKSPETAKLETAKPNKTW